MSHQQYKTTMLLYTDTLLQTMIKFSMLKYCINIMLANLNDTLTVNALTG